MGMCSSICTRMNPIMRKVDHIQTDLLKSKNFKDINNLLTKNFKLSFLKEENLKLIYNEIVNESSIYAPLFKSILDNFIFKSDLICKEILLFFFSITVHDDIAGDFFNIILMEDRTNGKKASNTMVEDREKINKKILKNI